VLVENGGKLRRKQQRARAAIEPQATIGVRPVPDYLTGSQRALWADLVADSPAGLLCRIDTDGLAAFVVMLDAQHALQRRYNEAGADPLSEAGAVCLRQMRLNWAHVRQWLIEYGFTPAARSRIAGMGAALANAPREARKPADPLARFIGDAA
jgi:hypothetical protein